MAVAGEAMLEITSNIEEVIKETEKLDKNISKLGSKKINIGGDIGGNISKVIEQIKKISGKSGIMNDILGMADMASNLREVNNLMEITFGEMTKEVDAFTDTVVEDYGIIEVKAKEMMGSFGAIFKNTGMEMKESVEYSKQMVQVIGDLASARNISIEEASSKVLSGVAGQARPLLELGVDLRVENVKDWYELQDGMNKTWEELNNGEKTIVRANMLMEQLKYTQGDFVNTNAEWANQIRILEQSFSGLKASIGEGFRVALLPVVKIINVIIKELSILASYVGEVGRKIGSAIYGIFGVEMPEEMENSSVAVGDLSVATEGLGGNVEELSNKYKKLNGELLKYDDFTVLGSKESGNLGEALSGIGAGGIDGSIIELNKGISKGIKPLDEIGNKVEGVFKRVKEEIEEIAGIFGEGFEGEILIKVIGENAKEILEGIGKAYNNVKETVKESGIGKEIGELVSNVGILAGEIMGLIGKFAEVYTEVTGIRSEFGKILNEKRLEIIEKINRIIENITRTVKELTESERGRKVLEKISEIIGNIEMAITGRIEKYIIDPILKLTEGDNIPKLESLADVVLYISEELADLESPLSKVIDGIIIFNTFVVPIIKTIAEIIIKMGLLVLSIFEIKKALVGLGIIAGTGEGVGIFAGIKAAIVGLGTWITGTAIPWVTTVLIPFLIANPIVLIIAAIVAAIAAIVVIWKKFGEDIKEWFRKAWEKVKETGAKIKEGIQKYVEERVEEFKRKIEIIKGVITLLKTEIETIIKGIKEVCIKICTTISTKVTEIVEGMKTKIKNKINEIKEGFSTVFTKIKDTVTRIVGEMVDKVKEKIEFIKGIIDGIKEKIKGVIEGAKELGNKIKDKVVGREEAEGVREIGVKAYAKGGIVKQPTLALVGESGPEIIKPVVKSRSNGEGLEEIGSSKTMERYMMQMIEENRKLRAEIAKGNENTNKRLKEVVDNTEKTSKYLKVQTI